MQRSLMTAAGVAFVAMGTVGIAPAQAGLLDFSFITQSGGTGSFTLNTDSLPDSNPALLIRADGSVTTGISYPNSISTFSFSAPYVNLSSLTADYSVYPSIPDSTGIGSLLGAPSGCIASTDIFCSVLIPIVYSGNVSKLPVLSADLHSYFDGSSVELFDPQTGERLSADPIIKFEAIPESDSGLSILAFGIGSAGLLLKKHKMNAKSV